MNPPNALQPYTPQEEVFDNQLVGQGPFVLPNICVCCGKATHQMSRQNITLRKSSPWAVVALFFAGLLGWLVAHYATRKSTSVNYSICPECMDKQRQKRLTMAGGLVWCGLVMMSGALVPEMFGVGLVSSIVFLTMMTVWRRFPVHIGRHDRGYFYLNGVHHNILNTIEQPKMFPAPPMQMLPPATHAYPPQHMPQHHPHHTPQTHHAPPSQDGTDGHL